MTDDLADGWHSPDDRKLMVRALERFSADCETPTLTPECPFFELDGSGQPQCAEQCQDVLSRYPDDKAPNVLTRLGLGLAAQRRRPRRGPSAHEAAFDAGKDALADAGRPLAERNFGTLLSMVRDRTYSPGAEREEGISDHELVAEIEQRGIQVDLTLPLALASDRVAALQIAMVLRGHEEEAEHVSIVGRQITGHLDDWLAVLEEFGGLHRAEGECIITAEARQAVTAWLSKLPIDQLFADAVPTLVDLQSAERAGLDQDLLDEGRWMLDRFTHTYLDKWRPQSRVREWRFINAHRPGCCPPGIMRQRPVDPATLAAVMADEHCANQEVDGDDGPTWTPAHFATMAIARLRAGRAEAAANVFRVLVDLAPKNAEYRNNLGFCLIASSPMDAITHLRASLEYGSPTPTLTQFNLGLALHLAGLAQEGLQVTLTALAEGTNEGDGTYVWEVRPDGCLDFVLIEDLLEYGESLVGHMSICEEGACVYADLLTTESDDGGLD